MVSKEYYFDDKILNVFLLYKRLRKGLLLQVNVLKDVKKVRSKLTKIHILAKGC